MSVMREAHFVGTVSQGSIYGLSSLSSGRESPKVLVASSKSKIYCTEYSRNRRNLLFSTKEVQFTYIPGQAEIISVDAFDQARHARDFVVGITFGKSDIDGKQSQYFNIYSSWEPSSEGDLDDIAQECLSIYLDFVPFHLTHAELFIDGTKEIVWLLSGSDCQVHLYREDKSQQTYSKEPVDLRFPEFKDLDSVKEKHAHRETKRLIKGAQPKMGLKKGQGAYLGLWKNSSFSENGEGRVTWMDFLTSEKERLTAFGCRDGTVAVSRVDLHPTSQVRASWRIRHDGPISNVRLFRDSLLDVPEGGSISACPVHLLVTNTLEVCVVYRNVAEEGLSLSSQRVLPKSGRYDSATCGLVADIDMDGENEILVGTYGQELLTYKWAEQSQEYLPIGRRSFPAPLLAAAHVDVTGDGLRELLVLTSGGLHILQHDLKMVTELCVQRMKLLLQNVSQEDLKKMLLKTK
ncbi:KICSTOR complex protein kaptin-like [Uloborus diversus]|uniref:KICSTOR complex protein kaptin-like n=1 Tax=Uloborus diversus TaxID=327109 RepID=UPI002409AC5E|nr:KICSTOR complex protein kaptin-like [Uloborus diversus]